MAAIHRPTEATYATHEQVTVDTDDHEDHTFCGIMFPVKCKDMLPLDHVVIHSIAVRGRLGPLTVWVSNNDNDEQPLSSPRRVSTINSNSNSSNKSFRMQSRFWTKIYERTHPPSFRTYCELDLRGSPIVLKPGQVRAIYIHSTLPGDEAIVYDNRHSRRTYDDELISILTGRAHVAAIPFGTRPIWGWGNPWRDQREFVGRIEYGAVYRLWNPQEFTKFGSKFQTLVRTLFLCQRRWESPLSKLPDDCIFYILNMCRWDWVNDTADDMKKLKKRNMERLASLPETSPDEEERNKVAAAATVIHAAEEAAVVTSTASCCLRSSRQTEDDDNGDEAKDAEEDEDEEEFEPDEDDDDDDDEAMHEDEEEDDDDEDESDDDDAHWDSGNDHRASGDVFTYRDDDSDDEQGNDELDQDRSRRAWIRRQFARIHVLQALATLEDAAVVDMNH